MRKSILRIANSWVPIERSEAARRGLTIKPLAPTHTSKELGLVLDRSVWFETRIAPRWIVAFRIVNQRGQPVIAESRIFPEEPAHYPPGRWSGEYGAPATVPPGGLSARALRQIRTQAFKADLHKIMTRKITSYKGKRSEEAWGTEEWESVFPGVPLLTVPPPTTRGRKGRSDRELARIAAAYERAYMANRPSIAAVAKAARLSLPQARDAVRRARTRGLLSGGGKQGKGGGLLMPLAREILKQDVKGKGGKRHGTKR
jgi:hypothetical protein